MIRLILPLFVLTALFWFVIYAATRKTKTKGLHVAKQFFISLGLAGLVLGTVSALFYFGGFINGN